MPTEAYIPTLKLVGGEPTLTVTEAKRAWQARGFRLPPCGYEVLVAEGWVWCDYWLTATDGRHEHQVGYRDVVYWLKHEAAGFEVREHVRTHWPEPAAPAEATILWPRPR